LHQRGKSRWGLCRPGGRPGRSTVRLASKEPLGSGRPLGRPSSN